MRREADPAQPYSRAGKTLVKTSDPRSDTGVFDYLITADGFAGDAVAVAVEIAIAGSEAGIGLRAGQF